MKNITLLLVALVAAGPVAAQSIIPRERTATAEREGKFSGDIARKVMDQFALCVLDRRRKLVLEALALPPDSPEQNEIFGELVRLDCIENAQLNFGGAAFRGSLYKALVRKQFGRKDVFPVPTPGADGAQATPVANMEFETRFLKFASCVVHKDPQHARDAILATAGSPVENAAIAALGNVYGQCQYEDAALDLPKGRLIALLAEAYYREGNALAVRPGE